MADHIRTLTVAITDGAEPGNEGRNYVLRRILRRAERYGRQYLGAKEPFLCELAPAVVGALGQAFPELTRDPGRVVAILRAEEESFIRTLDRGIKLFQEAAARAKIAKSGQISGADAFQLHDTFGLYVDITEQMAQESGLEVDRAGYDQLMQDARLKARGARKGMSVTALDGVLPHTDDSLKYLGLEASACKIAAWVASNKVVKEGSLAAGAEGALLLERTNFYAEQGGQVGDSGVIVTDTGRFEVEDTQRLGEGILHFGRVIEGRIEFGQPAKLQVSSPSAGHHASSHSNPLAELGLAKGPGATRRTEGIAGRSR